LKSLQFTHNNAAIATCSFDAKPRHTPATMQEEPSTDTLPLMVQVFHCVCKCVCSRCVSSTSVHVCDTVWMCCVWHCVDVLVSFQHGLGTRVVDVWDIVCTCVTLWIHGACHECGCVILIPKWPGNETSGCVRHWGRMIHAAHDVWDIAVHMYECTCEWDIVCEWLFLQPGTREAWSWVVAISVETITRIAKDPNMQLWLCDLLMFEPHQHVGVYYFT